MFHWFLTSDLITFFKWILVSFIEPAFCKLEKRTSGGWKPVNVHILFLVLWKKQRFLYVLFIALKKKRMLSWCSLDVFTILNSLHWMKKTKIDKFLCSSRIWRFLSLKYYCIFISDRNRSVPTKLVTFMYFTCYIFHSQFLDIPNKPSDWCAYFANFIFIQIIYHWVPWVSKYYFLKSCVLSESQLRC